MPGTTAHERSLVRAAIARAFACLGRKFSPTVAAAARIPSQIQLSCSCVLVLPLAGGTANRFGLEMSNAGVTVRASVVGLSLVTLGFALGVYSDLMRFPHVATMQLIALSWMRVRRARNPRH